MDSLFFNPPSFELKPVDANRFTRGASLFHSTTITIVLYEKVSLAFPGHLEIRPVIRCAQDDSQDVTQVLSQDDLSPDRAI